jgi:hypothetical protein
MCEMGPSIAFLDRVSAVQILLAYMVGARLAPMADETRVSSSAESTMAQTATTLAEEVKASSRQDLKDKIDCVSRSASSTNCRLSAFTTCICLEHAMRHPIA